ncbi:hypothetical protein AAC387_Pa08g1958 [Persea americana]
MTRRCSHCSHNGHNSRTCPNRGVRLFGVRLTDGSIRKSASMGNLTHYTGSSGGSNGNTPGSPAENPEHGGAADGYASEDFVPGSSSSCRERKKGVPWTEDEHRMFLLGLQKLGKGDWRGISRNFVVSRTPTQVASHAQKYFIRQTNVSRRKRRSSLFDMVTDEPVDTSTVVSQDLFPTSHQQPETQGSKPLPAPPALEEEWYTPEAMQKGTHEVVKPTAVHSKEPINVDELVGMSKLTLGESLGDKAPSSLSLKLLDGSDRQSAFHPNPATSGSSLNSGSSPIHAV